MIRSKKSPSVPPLTSASYLPSRPASIQSSSQLWLDLLKQAETIYSDQMQKSPFKVQPTSRFPFHTQFSAAVYGCLRQAMNEKIKSEHERLSLELSLLTLFQKLMKRIDQLNTLNTLCGQYNCLLLRPCNQFHYPFLSLTGPLCTGIVYRWAQQLYTNPPKDFRAVTSRFKHYRDFLNILQQEKFPEKLHAIDSHQGDLEIDHYTIQYKRYFNELDKMLLSLKAPRYDSDEYSGKMIGQAALDFLEEQYQANPKSIVIATVILGSVDIKKFWSHIMGFARIQQGRKVYYRFFDSDIGEFQTSTPEKFPEWFEQYSKTLGYDNTSIYSRFQIERIDGILSRLDPFIDALNLKQSLRSPFTLRSILLNPLLPFAPSLPSSSSIPSTSSLWAFPEFVSRHSTQSNQKEYKQSTLTQKSVRGFKPF